MQASVLVTNQAPTLDRSVPEHLLRLFQACAGPRAIPFEHQTEAFRLLCDDKELFLVAGTAAGKTLAVSLPLFYKLKLGRINKVLLMYPTVALLEDQRRVMDMLAQVAGLEVGLLQGGMSRSALMAALTKPVIMSTPDEVYWFFRKEIKYNSLLIYGLTLVDEFVLDEAHLFAGIMLQNFEHLWRRIKSLATLLNKRPRLHILTATPLDALERLNKGVRVSGQSKCRDVTVVLRLCERFERGQGMSAAVEHALEEGRKKVLVVCNSARVAHQLFEKYTVNGGVGLPTEHKLRFGKVQFGTLLEWLERCGEREVSTELSARFFHQEDVALADLPAGTGVTVALTDVVARATDVLEHQCRRIKYILWEQKQRPGETLESLLHNRPLPCAIVTELRPHLRKIADLERQQALVDEWLTEALESLGTATEEQIPCQAPDYSGLQEVLTFGLGRDLAELVAKRLVYEIKVSPAWTGASLRRLSRRPIYLRWLNWLVDKDQAERIRTLVQRGLKSDELRADYRHIRFWKGTDVPVIVYSGSMAKHARAGLIDVFANLEQAVLISTSAVEVGVDFAADTLITEECEGNSFLQRFGRVGRHGNDSRALALVSGGTAASWRDLDGQHLSRDEFSARVRETFPQRNYAVVSALVDAGHYLVNEQLGRIGARLNQDPELAAARPLAEQLRAAEIPVGFGLRSTLPQVTLKDGVTKDPFYLLHYVDDQDLRQADSPFEVARAKTWFTELIFQKARFNVMVDLNTTLQASRAWFWIAKGGWQVKAQPGIGWTYLSKMSVHYAQGNEWNPWVLGNFLLLQGDVYLQRTERGVDYPKPEPVCDDEKNPLFIPAQNYMVFLGWRDVDEAKARIAVSPIVDWEELHYDWDGVPYNNALVLLERTAGACFAAYKEWLDYAGRRV